VCGDLTNVFNFDAAGKPPVPEHPGPVPPAISRWRPNPPANQTAPTQEPGTRPARPLPYRPRIQASADAAGVTLELANSGKRSAHFIIYGYQGELAEPQHVDVLGRQKVHVPVPSGSFDLTVLGPNRFQYETKGSTAGAAAGVVLTVTGRDGQHVELEISNHGRDSVRLEARSLQYANATEKLTLKSGQRRTLAWPAPDGWYDIALTSVNDTGFRRRATGREEDGSEGVSG
jgi:phospholipase C